MPLFRKAICLVFTVLAAAFGTGPAFAQAYQPGEQIEYKAQNWPEKWEKGVYLRDTPGGSQVIVREAPSQFFPEGFQRAYSLSDVRPVTQAAAPPDQADQALMPAPPPARPRAPPLAPARPEAAPLAEPDGGGGMGGGGGLMSQQEVLSFLRERLGDGDPFRDPPRREATMKALREEVLRRGVDFHYRTIGAFGNEMSKFGVLGAQSDATSAMLNNFGPPAALNQLTGTWRLIKVGATTTVTRGGRLYQRQEYAGLAGSLNIGAGGDYVWNSPSGLLRGRWRSATPEEMAKSDKGGEGVVLLGAKGGWDWLVFRRTEEGPEGTGIKITDLGTRNLRERGTR